MIEENPWQTLSSQEKYNNNWIKVTEHQVINPSGGSGIYGEVHFKNIAIGVVPIDSDGNTWLVKQSRYSLNQYTWEIPEGGAPAGTDPFGGADRDCDGRATGELRRLCRAGLCDPGRDNAL